MSGEEIEQRIKTHFPDAILRLSDLTGGGDHWQLEIKSEAFRGKSLVQQHQLIYQALGEWMKNKIHALTIRSSVP